MVTADDVPMGFAVSPWLASGSLTFGFCFDLVTPHPSRRPTETQKQFLTYLREISVSDLSGAAKEALLLKK